MVTSKVSAQGFLLASIQNGAAVVTHYANDGSIIWSKRIAVPGMPPLRWVHTVEFIDGGPEVYVLASSVPYLDYTVAEHFYLIELDADQVPTLSTSFGDVYENCGGHQLQHSRIGHAQVHPDGGYMVSLPNNGNFTCVCRIDEVGGVEWWRLYSAADWTTAANQDFSGFWGAPLSDGGMLLPNTVEGGFHLHRLDADGSVIWGRKYITGNVYDQAWRAVELADGTVVLTGLHGINVGTGAHWIFLMKLDVDGEIIWHRRISNEFQTIHYPGFPYGLRVDGEGNILIRAHIYSDREHLIRCNADGVVQEMVMFDVTEGFQEGMGVAFRPDGSIVATGSVQNDFGVQWTESPFVMTAPDLSSLDCAATPVPWIDEPYPTNVTTEETAAVLDYQSYVVVDIDPLVSPSELVREEGCLPTSGPNSVDSGYLPQILPNPSRVGEILNVLHPAPIQSIRVVNMEGRPVPFSSMSVDTGHLLVNLECVAPGLYLLQIISLGNTPYVERFVVLE